MTAGTILAPAMAAHANLTVLHVHELDTGKAGMAPPRSHPSQPHRDPTPDHPPQPLQTARRLTTRNCPPINTTIVAVLTTHLIWRVFGSG